MDSMVADVACVLEDDFPLGVNWMDSMVPDVACVMCEARAFILYSLSRGTSAPNCGLYHRVTLICHGWQRTPHCPTAQGTMGVNRLVTTDFAWCVLQKVCRAPKRRFIAYQEPVSRNANSTATRKARKAELQSEAPGGGINPAILIGAGVALLVVLYVVLNATV